MTNNNQNLLFVEFKKEDIEQSVPDRLRQMVERYPERIAVKSRTATLTYAELDKASNRIASMLRNKQGDGLEPIGILTQQGAGFITAIMSVLKLGKIYVPLEPKFPRKRLTQIIEDAKMKALLTNSTNMVLAEELTQQGCQLLNIDEVDEGISSDKLEISVPPETPAYIIYTSGSTGRPKGLLQNHRNLLHNARNQINAMKISAGDRMTMFYSPSVMGGVRCIYNALLNGAGLYTFDVREEGLVNLAAWLESEEITVYHSVATLFRHFTSVLTGTNLFPKLRLLVLGGEAVAVKDVELYKQYFHSNCIMHTGLGSTEAGTIRQDNIYKDTQIEGSRVPLGYAAEDMEVLLVDDTGREVEPGQVGEMWIRSEYLALGYWQNPSKTAEAFIQAPEGSTPRIYRSGDLGKLLPDGRLVHQGRKDFQVKIRGFRVELPEIERALVNHKSVKEAVVVGKEDPSGEQSLVAYIVPVSMPDRFPYQSHLQVELSEKTINLKTEDISHESIGVIGITSIFGEGQEVRLHLQLPGETNKCDLVGKVVWVQEPRARIEFQLSPDEKMQVERSIQYLCEAEGCFKFLESTIVGNLRNHLKQVLPDYMVPSAFVLLESLPLTPNGKINRLALPEPDDLHPELAENFVAPRTEVEQELASIWGKVLGLEKVGVEDNFFELGGHSLLAIRLVEEIKQKFNQQFPITVLFQAPTVAELSQYLKNQETVNNSAGVVALRSEGHRPRLFLVAPGSSTALQYHHLVSYLPKQQPCYCFQSIEIENPETMLTTIEEIAAYYLEQMLTVDAQGPYILAGRCGVGVVIIYEMALQLQGKGKQVNLIMLDPSYEAFRNIKPEPQAHASSWLYYPNIIKYHWQRKQLITRIKEKFFSRDSQQKLDGNDIEKINKSNLSEQKKSELISLFQQQRRAKGKYKPQKVYQGKINLILTEYRQQFGLVRYDYWQQLATEGLDIQMVPGHHNTMLYEPNVQLVAEKVKLCLAKIDG